jgi:hypothetical protein
MVLKKNANTSGAAYHWSSTKRGQKCVSSVFSPMDDAYGTHFQCATSWFLMNLLWNDNRENNNSWLSGTQSWTLNESSLRISLLINSACSFFLEGFHAPSPSKDCLLTNTALVVPTENKEIDIQQLFPQD